MMTPRPAEEHSDQMANQQKKKKRQEKVKDWHISLRKWQLSVFISICVHVIEQIKCKTSMSWCKGEPPRKSSAMATRPSRMPEKHTSRSAAEQSKEDQKPEWESWLNGIHNLKTEGQSYKADGLAACAQMAVSPCTWVARLFCPLFSAVRCKLLNRVFSRFVQRQWIKPDLPFGVFELFPDSASQIKELFLVVPSWRWLFFVNRNFCRWSVLTVGVQRDLKEKWYSNMRASSSVSVRSNTAGTDEFTWKLGAVLFITNQSLSVWQFSQQVIVIDKGHLWVTSEGLYPIARRSGHLSELATTGFVSKSDYTRALSQVYQKSFVQAGLVFSQCKQRSRWPKRNARFCETWNQTSSNCCCACTQFW